MIKSEQQLFVIKEELEKILKWESPIQDDISCLFQNLTQTQQVVKIWKNSQKISWSIHLQISFQLSSLRWTNKTSMQRLMIITFTSNLLHSSFLYSDILAMRIWQKTKRFDRMHPLCSIYTKSDHRYRFKTLTTSFKRLICKLLRRRKGI